MCEETKIMWIVECDFHSRFKLVDIVKFMSAILVPGMPYFFRLFNISVWKKNETMFFYHVITNTLKEVKQNESQQRRSNLHLHLVFIRGCTATVMLQLISTESGDSRDFFGTNRETKELSEVEQFAC